MTPFDDFVLSLFSAGDRFGAPAIARLAFRPADYEGYIAYHAGEYACSKASLKNLAEAGRLVHNGDQTFSLPE